MSDCTSARQAAKSAVNAADVSHDVAGRAACSKSGSARTMRNTPAATIVAACSRAETGVGPSIASGSQMCSGNCADLPTTAKKSISVTNVATGVTAVHSKRPSARRASTRPIRKPRSANLVTQKAFTAAFAALGLRK
jgi:hypothetical protein